MATLRETRMHLRRWMGTLSIKRTLVVRPLSNMKEPRPGPYADGKEALRVEVFPGYRRVVVTPACRDSMPRDPLPHLPGDLHESTSTRGLHSVPGGAHRLRLSTQPPPPSLRAQWGERALCRDGTACRVKLLPRRVQMLRGEHRRQLPRRLHPTRPHTATGGIRGKLTGIGG